MDFIQEGGTSSPVQGHLHKPLQKVMARLDSVGRSLISGLLKSSRSVSNTEKLVCEEKSRRAAESRKVPGVLPGPPAAHAAPPCNGRFLLQ